MTKAFKPICVILIVLCLMRSLYGLTGPINIQQKFQRFTNSQIFDYDGELIALQKLQYSFRSLTNQMSAAENERYEVWIEYPIDSNVIVGGSVIIYDTNGEGVAKFAPDYRIKGDDGFLGEVANFFNYTVQLLQNLGFFLAETIANSLETLGSIAVLIIEIVFLP